LFDAGVTHARSRNVAQATQRDSMDHPCCGNTATVSKEATVDSLGSQDQSKNAKSAKNAKTRSGARASREQLHIVGAVRAPRGQRSRRNDAVFSALVAVFAFGL
jgi:hypothetical protein